MFILIFLFGMFLGAMVVLAIWAATLDDEIKKLERAEINDIAYMDATLEDMFNEEVKRNNVDA